MGNITSHLILMGLGSWARLPGRLGGHLGVSEKASGGVTFPWGPEAGGHHRGSKRSIFKHPEAEEARPPGIHGNQHGFGYARAQGTIAGGQTLQGSGGYSLTLKVCTELTQLLGGNKTGGKSTE